jgi:hypothetical protein
MSTPLQPIWLIHPIEPPTEPVLVVQEPLTELIPVQLPRYMGTGQVLPTARRPAEVASARPRLRGHGGPRQWEFTRMLSSQRP